MTGIDVFQDSRLTGDRQDSWWAVCLMYISAIKSDLYMGMSSDRKYLSTLQFPVNLLFVKLVGGVVLKPEVRLYVLCIQKNILQHENTSI